MLLRQRGDKIEAVKGYYSEYLIEFEQRETVEEDKARNCKKYPMKGNKSYGACDQIFIRKALDGLGLTNLTPIWATNNFEEVTENVQLELSHVMKLGLSDLASGVKMSNCKKPCRSTTTYVKFLTRNKDPKNGTYILLHISEDVSREMTKMVEFNFLTCLSFLGSNMGLWLGLGALQLLEELSGLLVGRMRKNVTLKYID